MIRLLLLLAFGLVGAVAPSGPGTKPPKRSAPKTEPVDDHAVLPRLSAIMLRYQDHKEQRDQLDALLDQLRGAGLMTVLGEETLLRTLDERLGEIDDLLPTVGVEKDPLERLDRLESLVGAVDWEVAQRLTPLLEAKIASQEKVIGDFKQTVDAWKKRLDPVRAEVQRAREANAPVRTDEASLLRWEDLVRQVDRALQDLRFADVADPLAKLKLEEDAPEKLVPIVADKALKARRFRRQAEVLLLRAPADNRHVYTVLLRTPSDSGSHGINIQDSSTLYYTDRQYVRTVIDKITSAVDAGLVRRFETTGLGVGAAVGLDAPLEPGIPAGGAAPIALAGAGPATGPAAAEVAAPAASAAAAPAASAAAAPAASAAAAPAASAAAGPAAEAGPKPAVPDRQQPLGAAVREWNPAMLLPEAAGDLPQAENVEKLIRDVGEVMFRLFMPDQMRNYLSANPCSLTITTNDLELPWELMHDVTWDDDGSAESGGFLCLRRPVARMPMGRAFPRKPNEITPHTKLRFLLVHADPTGNLPAAKHEIEQIRDGLNARWNRPEAEQIEIKVLEGAGATGQALNEALLSGSYDVIHFAGHAAFDEQNPDLSGLVLNDSEVFYSQKIQRLLEGRPLVFLNACETGRSANEANAQAVGEYFWKPAEGLASAFLYGGALGCVGSLWPIFDGPAAQFAISFYNEVLEGQMIGEAMRQARISLKKNHPETITWASFVLYGDPTFRLVR